MSDLVKRLQNLAAHLDRVGDSVHNPTCTEAAATIEAQAAEIERLRAGRDEAREIVRDTHWMAVRYADGRMSYAPGMCNRALRKAYDAGWLTYHDNKQHDHDPQYAREGDRPEYRSIESRAEQAESALALIYGGLELLLAATHANDQKREIQVRVGDLMRIAQPARAFITEHGK